MKRKKLTKLSFEALGKAMPVLSEEDKSKIIGGDYVIITMDRYGYGNTTTASTFNVSIFNDSGTMIGEPIIGYMLEPETNYNLSTTSGSGTAISSGSYSIIHRADGKYEIVGVPGRSGILIHTGNSGGDTTGCLIPGTSLNYSGSTSNESSDPDNTSGDYTIPGGASTPMYNILAEIMQNHGQNGVTININ
jgi:hypothetical protein